MIIQDDGDGFKNETDLPQRKGLGLRNMKERIASHDGKFKLSNGQPTGVTLEVYLTGKLNDEKAS